LLAARFSGLAHTITSKENLTFNQDTRFSDFFKGWGEKKRKDWQKMSDYDDISAFNPIKIRNSAQNRK